MKPETNADGLEHRLATEWHRQIHHDSRLEADNRRLIAVAASGQDDGRVWKALVEPGREPELALFGYLDVTEDHICRARHHFVKCRLSVSCLCRLVAVTADPGGQECSNRRLVVNDQHQSHLALQVLIGGVGLDDDPRADEVGLCVSSNRRAFFWVLGAARTLFSSCPTRADSVNTGNTGPTWFHRPGQPRSSGTLGT